MQRLLITALACLISVSVYGQSKKEIIQQQVGQITELTKSNSSLQQKVHSLNNEINSLQAEIERLNKELTKNLISSGQKNDSLAILESEIQRIKTTMNGDLDRLKLHENSIKIPAKLISISELFCDEYAEKSQGIRLEFCAPYHGGTYYANLRYENPEDYCQQTHTHLQFSDFIIESNYNLYIGLQFWGFDIYAEHTFGAVYIDKMTEQQEMQIYEYYDRSWPESECYAATFPTGPSTKISFNEYEHDFGVIDEGDVKIHIFEFKNTGDQPLILEKCTGSCRCTVPVCPKEPIEPGATGSIEVKFNSKGKKNKQTKKVTVTANTYPVQTILTINAQVIPAP